MMTESAKACVDQANWEWESAMEMRERLRWPINPSTLRRHLNSGVEAGVLECRYVGNGRYGKNEYRMKS